ncbi:type II secretion system protein GspM [Pseudomonas argentinensis]|uniref:Type II secretion system protein M (GspM) n=1 Tax=Phytopseudomonas argentinensis TaxID=289370 RepID=A0A1I3K193_9GAMM|nr:type II secretion system protein GspM [Pseudomonas argentinensis]KAB0550863.1 type II secretion system protein GspM [Pseudomonas argentinensis]SFI66262.1 type II secretion system protein M (GspM) [Pseudomonas argentinensis]
MSLNLERRSVRLLAVAIIVVLLALLAWREGQQRWQAFGQWQALAGSTLALGAGRTLSADDLQQAAKARDIRIDTLEPDTEQWLLRGQLKDERVLQDWLLQLQLEGAQLLRWSLRREESALHFELALQR